MTSTIETTDKPNRILVGDDDEAIREIMTSILTSAGYACRVAKTLAETLKILESGEHFDLVMCGTAECAEADFERIIRITAPYDIPVVVSTGVVGLVESSTDGCLRFSTQAPPAGAVALRRPSCKRYRDSFGPD